MAVNPGVGEIQAKRRKLLDGFDANEDFEEGLNESGKNLYAQECHFIYELLQNAGDAQATRVEFTLTRQSLEFRHNGARNFSLEDVNSITNYHRSTKGKDFEAVGKFGMGFKSVYHYTATPEIHSGDFHFRIKRMFYPETEGVRVDEVLNNWTKFTFPFDSQYKSPQEAFSEIRKGLSGIGAETLLFLRRIARIECMLENGEYLSILREESNHVVRIRRTVGSHEADPSYFLKFSRPLRVAADGRSIDFALAYGLSPKTEHCANVEVGNLSARDFSLAPLNGRVFIYFPAEKETSKLRFHIHASFASPMSRESLTDGTDNDRLVEDIASLAVESLPFLRDNGLLSVDKLGIFPIPNDGLSRRYEVIREQLVAAFNHEKLTPTKSGSFKPAADLMRSENRMADLFTDDDIVRIYQNYESPVWVKAPAMNHSREDDFLKALDLEMFGNADLLGLVIGEGHNGDKLEKLVTSFDDRKLLEFYKKLADIPERERRDETWFGRRGFRAVFRTTDGSMARPDSLFFPIEGVEGKAFRFLKKVYKDTDNKLIGFLQSVGVRTYSIANILKELAGKQSIYRTIASDSPEMKLHMAIVKLLITGYSSDRHIVNEFPSFLWLGETESGSFKLAKAVDLLMDAPYQDTGMREIRYAYPSKLVLSAQYKNELNESEFEALKDLLKHYSFITEFREQYINKDAFLDYSHPCYKELKLPEGCRKRNPWYRDCVIENIKTLVERKDDNLSKRIWMLLPRLKNSGIAHNPFKAIVRYNAGCTKEADSLLICSLRTLPWIKTIDGQWKKPADVNFATLHPMYESRERCEALTAILFGAKAAVVERAELERQKAQAELVEEVGAASKEEIREAVELMKSAKREGIDVKGMILRKRVAAEMPENASSNVASRQEKTSSVYAESEVQQRELRERSVRISQTMEREAHHRLIREYTDDSKRMRCQLCRHEMPFKKRNGEVYFECVQVFRGMQKESADQYLALCPTCYAIYDEWIRKHEANAAWLKAEIIRRSVNDGQGRISIDLPDTGTPDNRTPPTTGMSLYFTGKHFVDIQTVLHGECG